MQEKISTGSDELDSWLDGGYERDVITTLYGPAGSGKTNLCLIAAVQIAKNKKVIFIDTEGGFSVSRLKQLADEKVMQNILLLKATNFREQREAFDRLLDEIRGKVGLIIVDSMVMLYRLELGSVKDGKEGEKVNEEQVRAVNRSLARQLRILNEIARKKLIPILVTDQVYSSFREDKDKVSMVGGDLLKYWSKCLIELRNDDGKKKAILRKHRSLPEKEFGFEINNHGIAKAKRFKLF